MQEEREKEDEVLSMSMILKQSSEFKGYLFNYQNMYRTHMSYCSQHRRKAGKWGGGSRNLVIISKIDVIEEMLILVRVLCRLFEDINILLLEKNILLSDKLIMFLKSTNYYKENVFLPLKTSRQISVLFVKSNTSLTIDGLDD